MAFEGAISSLVKMRDEDGSVDRVQDPPDALWPILAAMRYKAIDNHIDLPSIMVEGGGSPIGTMSTRKFMSAIVNTFRMFELTQEVLEAIERAYGCGYKDVRGKYENSAWKDFCEDVERSIDMDTSNGVAEALAATRGAKISFGQFMDNSTLSLVANRG